MVGHKLEHDPDFKGPIRNRSCTDIICLVLILAFLIGWCVLAIFAFRMGNPKLLIYPTDSEGNLCGEGKLKNKSNLFFFDPLKCVGLQPIGLAVFQGCPTPQVCVAECPTSSFSTLKATNQLKQKLICKYDVSEHDLSSKSIQDLVQSGACAPYYIKSTSVAGRCFPDFGFTSSDVGKNFDINDDETGGPLIISGFPLNISGVNDINKGLSKLLEAKNLGEKVFQDLEASWQFMLIGLLIAMGLSLLWIFLMRFFAGVMVFASMLAITGLLAYGCYHCVYMYMQLKDSPSSDSNLKVTVHLESNILELRKTWLAFAIITGAVLAILLLLMIFLRTRILIAIALLKEGSRAVGKMMSTLFFPLIPYIFQFGTFAFWAAVALYLASSGKKSHQNITNGTACDPTSIDSFLTEGGAECMFTHYTTGKYQPLAQVFNVFGLFWIVAFIVGVGQVTLAGAFASYYWTRKKDSDLPTFAILSSFCRCVRYHMGSVAFGSLLLAIVKLIRLLLEYLDKKCKKYENVVTKCILLCCKCCFWCLEKFIKFINKNAYIMIAIYGKNFCVSSKNAFTLLMRNIVRVVVLDKVTDFLLFLGKLVVTATSGILAFFFFSGKIEVIDRFVPSVNYYAVPIVVISFGAYIIASCFFSVFSMAVDTLFLCFLEDCERNDGSAERPYYMSKELMKILGKKNRFAEPHS